MTTPSFEQLFPSEGFEKILFISEHKTPPGTSQKLTSLSLEEALGPDQLSGKWDLIILSLTDLLADQADIQQLISRCRDLLSRRLVILLEATPDATTRQHLMGLGLHQLAENTQVFYHDLFDYKPTPDWLNNRFWANPELWNKYRW